jgi:hypothetical protein
MLMRYGARAPIGTAGERKVYGSLRRAAAMTKKPPSWRRLVLDSAEGISRKVERALQVRVR